MGRFSPDKDSEVEVVYGNDGRRSPRETFYQFNPFGHSEDDDVEEFFDDNSNDEFADEDENPNRIFFDPKKSAVLNEGVHEIPGSPWAKPANRPSTRPTEPLPIARYASAIAFTLTFGWCVSIFVLAIWNYSSIGRIIVEVMLGKLDAAFNTILYISCNVRGLIATSLFATQASFLSLVCFGIPILPWRVYSNVLSPLKLFVQTPNTVLSSLRRNLHMLSG